jgi:hypothetical protein
MLARPGVEKGSNVPVPHTMLTFAQLSSDEIDAKVAEEMRKMLAGPPKGTN